MNRRDLPSLRDFITACTHPFGAFLKRASPLFFVFGISFLLSGCQLDAVARGISGTLFGGNALTINPVSDIVVYRGVTPSATSPITVIDQTGETGPVLLSAVSNNTALIPNNSTGLQLTQTGALSWDLVTTWTVGQTGLAQVTLLATKGSYSASRTLNVTVYGQPVLSFPSFPYTFPAGVGISPISVTNTGGPIASCAITAGSLPAGLSFNTSTCQITGTPTTAGGPSSVTIQATNPAGASNSASVSITVTAGTPTQIEIFANDNQTGPVALPLGAPFVARVKDGNNNLVSGATVVWSVFSGGGSLSALTTTTDANGKAQNTLTLGTLIGVNQAKATLQGTSQSVTFSATAQPGAAASFVISPVSSPQTVGVGFALVLTVKDAQGNTATGYSGTVQLTSTDGSASLPGNHVFVPATDNGTYTFTGVTFNSFPGPFRVTATDTLNGTLTAQTGLINVSATDTTPPTVSSLSGVNNQTLQITFSEAMGAGSGTSAITRVQNYALSPGGGQGSFATNPNSVTQVSPSVYLLTWNSPQEMKIGGTVTVTVSNVIDVAGNVIGSPNSASTIGQGVAPTAATGLSWQQSSPTNVTTPTMNWTKSVSSDLSNQKILLYAQSACGGAATTIDLSSSTLQTYTSVAALTNGTTYSFKVQSLDAAGNSIDSGCSGNLLIDTSAPTAATGLSWQQSSPTNVTTPTMNWTKSVSSDLSNQKILLYAQSACGGAATTIDLSSSTLQTYTSLAALTNGTTYSFKVQSLDAAGNSMDSSCSGNLLIDTSAPAAATGPSWQQSSPTNVTTPTMNWTKSVSSDLANQKILRFAQTACGGAATTIDLSSSTLQTYTSVATLINGVTYSFKVQSLDAAGNSMDTSCSGDLVIDTTPPTIAISNPAASSYINIANSSASFAVSGTCSEASQTVTIKVNGSNAGNATCTGTLFSGTINTTILTDGLYSITAQISDQAGNSTTSSAVSVTKDTTAPTASTGLSWQQSSPTSVTTPTMNWTKSVSFDLANQKILLYSQTACAGAATTIDLSSSTLQTYTSVTALTNGVTYSFKVQSIDTAGNLTDSSCSGNLLIDTTPPTAATSLSWQQSSPTNVTTPTMNWTKSVSSDLSNQKILRYAQSACGGAATTIDLSSSSLQTYTSVATLTNGVTYSFKVQAVDQAGNSTDSSCSGDLLIDTVAPVVAGVSPVNAATGIAVGTTVTATFTEANTMNASTLTTSTFTLVKTSDSSSVTGTVSYDSGTKTVTFTPGSSLAANTQYTATLSTGIKDTAGNALASTYTWSFTTQLITVNLSDPWIERGGPSRRTWTTVFNINNKVYLLGGVGVNQVVELTKSELWKLDPTGYAGSAPLWTKLQPSGPIPSKYYPITAQLNNKIYWLGGSANKNSCEYNSDFYVFDPASGTDGAWTQLSPAGPTPARCLGAAVSLDTGSGEKMYVFGGLESGFSLPNDLYRYDPTIGPQGTWTILNPIGTPPPGIYQYTSTAINGKLYIYGGYTETGDNTTLYRYDPTQGSDGRWDALNPTGTSPGVTHYAAAASVNGAMTLIASEKFNLIFTYTPGVTDDGAWSSVTAPYWMNPAGLRRYIFVPDTSAPPAMTVYNSKILASYGGRRAAVLYDPSNNSWSNLSTTPRNPNNLSRWATAFNNRLYRWAFDEISTKLRVYQFDPTQGSDGNWFVADTSGTAPPVYFRDTSAQYAPYTLINNLLYFFGGATNDATSNDTYTFNLGSFNAVNQTAGSWDLLSTVSPPPARGHATYFQIGNIIYLFGGDNQTIPENYSDTWAFNLATNSWTNLNPSGTPPPSTAGNAAGPGGGYSTIVYNGKAYVTDSTSLDVYVYDPTTNQWSQGTAGGMQPSVNNFGAGCTVNYNGKMYSFLSYPTLTQSLMIFDPTIGYFGTWTDSGLKNPKGYKFNSCEASVANNKFYVFGSDPREILFEVTPP